MTFLLVLLLVATIISASFASFFRWQVHRLEDATTETEDRWLAEQKERQILQDMGRRLERTLHQRDAEIFRLEKELEKLGAQNPRGIGDALRSQLLGTAETSRTDGAPK